MATGADKSGIARCFSLDMLARESLSSSYSDAVLGTQSPAGAQMGMSNLWRHRDLILQLTIREISARYKGTYLGVLWSLLTPLVMLSVYTVVFSMIFHVRWREVDTTRNPGHFTFALFAGLIPFSVFSEVVTRAPSLILSTPNYVKKVVFPLEVLPVVIVGASVVHSLISVVLLVIAMGLFWGFLSSTLFLLPLVYIPLICLCLGLSWLLASLGVYVRDIGQSIGLVVQMLFFLSPIFFPVTAAPESLRTIFYLNPLTWILDAFRQVVLWGEPLKWEAWSVLTAGAAILAWLGYLWFTKTKRGFADVM